MNFKLITAAALLCTAIAAPALAQDPVARGPHVRNEQARVYHHRNSSFWPGEVAAGVVGGAIGTAGAIATAPFRDTYAYDDDYGYRYDNYNNYGDNNGFVCQPGTTFIGQDRRPHLCQ